MLAYRHAFHAGNHADVLKHFTLARLIALLSRKEAPFAYLDSHAGVGLYDLLGDQASRTDEWREGIGRLWDLPDLPAPMADYLKVVRELNPDGNLRYYPGSPELARRLTRPQDRLQLNEKHPEDGLLLKDNMAGDRRVAVHLGEGWHIARALLPVPLVLLEELRERLELGIGHILGRQCAGHALQGFADLQNLVQVLQGQLGDANTDVRCALQQLAAFEPPDGLA